MSKLFSVYVPKKKAAKTLAMVLLFILCLIAAGAGIPEDEPVASYNMASKIVVIDPGHGGVDSGAMRGDTIEKEITLEISQKLASQLSQAGAAVIMTRSTDTDLAKEDFKGSLNERKRKDLTNRVNKANQAGADLFISIHTNADPNPRWSGAQTFYTAVSEESKKVAECIQEEMVSSLGNTKRTALAGDYFVMKHTEMPAVIVEVGFISNPDEARLLKDEKYQLKVAEAIFKGIVRSFTPWQNY